MTHAIPRVACLSALALLSLAASAQFGPPGRADQPGMPGAFGPPGMPGMPGVEQPLVPGMGLDGPAGGSLRLAVVEPDRRPTSRLFLQAAGVPSLARLADGRIIAAYQWFPTGEPAAFDRIAVQFSDDGLSWTLPETIQVDGLPEGFQRPFDPALAPLDDGRVRLYFTCGPQMPPQMPGLGRPDTAIYCAESEDGIHYQALPDAVWTNPDGELTNDASVCRIGEEWHLICPGHPFGAWHAVSDDGQHFELATPIAAEPDRSWIGNLAEIGGEPAFFGGSPRGIWRARYDGAGWSAPETIDIAGGDPAVLPQDDGSLLVLVVVSDRRPARGMMPMPPGAQPQPDGRGGFQRR